MQPLTMPCGVLRLDFAFDRHRQFVERAFGGEDVA